MRRNQSAVSPSSFSYFIYLNLALAVAAFALIYVYLPQRTFTDGYYNTSQLIQPVLKDNGDVEYKIAVVTDLDHDSKHPEKKNTWISYLMKGVLTIKKGGRSAVVNWDHANAVTLTSQIAAGGRSMELSDLVVFNGHLYTVDDRTGIVYRIDQLSTLIPWVLLSDGPGDVAKGFKSEWLTVKDGHLIVGGLGKEWTTTKGEFVNYHPMYIKKISPRGEVEHINWVDNYKALRAAVGIQYPGYMIHESGQWSEIKKKWFFMPRRASKGTYSEDDDETRGTNYLLTADADFRNIEVQTIGTIGDGHRGFSAFQFIPNSLDDIIVALKSEERNGRPVGSYITVFRVSDGHILLPESKLHGNHKYEGIAFT